jgi:N-carbamoylputrescine amidase
VSPDEPTTRFGPPNDDPTPPPQDGDLTRRDFVKKTGAGMAACGMAALSDAGASAPPSAESSQPRQKEEKPQVKDHAKITLVQLPLEGKRDTVIERMPAFFDKATEYGSDLIVFPEYILGSRITVDHENVQRFFALAREHKIYAIAGLVEAHGAKWATTALMVDRSGSLLGRYFKCHPASGPAPHWWPPIKGEDAEARGILGNQFKVFHLDFAPVGILQCYDGYFPEAWGCTSFSGAEIILWINGRDGIIEDYHCMFAAHAYGCVVGGCITDGRNTGFASPGGGIIAATGRPEEARLFPRIKERGDACVHATINLKALRRHRKHLRTMHQRRPELYRRLTEDIKIWQDYPDIPWDFPECQEFVNRAQL